MPHGRCLWQLPQDFNTERTEHHGECTEFIAMECRAEVTYARAWQRMHNPLLRAFSVVLRALRVKAWRWSN
jgi:hypothetical protein